MGEHFVTVYQIAANQFASLTVLYSAIRATAVLVAVAGFITLAVLVSRGVPKHRIVLLTTSLIGVGFVILGTTLALQHYQTDDALSAFQSGQYSVVEGPVTAFDPMPFEGHKAECFSVQAIRFCYSDYVVTPGFRNTSSHGGPIHSGMLLRIAYREVGSHHVILRLEIAK